MQQRWAVGLFSAIAVGIIFRLIWLNDIENKFDEAWTFKSVQAGWRTGVLQTTGVPSSAGVPTGGMSLWAFLAISTVSLSVDALGPTRAVQLINVVTIEKLLCRRSLNSVPLLQF